MKQALVLILLLALFLASLSLGVYGPINPLSPAGSLERAVLERRLVRSLAAVMVGVGLAASGAGLQSILRNPLAEPYLLGVSAGAALGVLLPLSAGFSSPAILHASAFAGGIAVLALVLFVSSAAGLTSLSMIVAGVAVSSAVGALDMMLIMQLGPRVHGALAWLFGTVAYAMREDLLYSLLPVAAGACLIAARSSRLEALSLGEEVAESMGVRVRPLRLEVVAAATIATSGVVAFAGPVGFVGLVAPWIARLTIGGGFRRLYPASLAAGAAVTLGADVAARFLAPAGGSPLTAVTALVGAPLIVYLVASWGRRQ